MSELFSQFVSLLTPKYSKIESNEKDWHPDVLLKNHFRATMTVEDRNKYFPDHLTPPSSVTTPVTTPVTTSVTTPADCTRSPATPADDADLYDVKLDDEPEEAADNVPEAVDEVQEHKTSDLVNLVTEKTQLQIGDLIPSINNILNDHGIRDKLKDFKISVKNKLQKEDQATEKEETDPKVSFLSNLSLPKAAALFGPDSEKLYPLKQSKDKTVQTYFPGH